jgi:hypothetical protein
VELTLKLSSYFLSLSLSSPLSLSPLLFPFLSLIHYRDNFDATIFDYARMLGMIPQTFEKTRDTDTIAVYQHDKVPPFISYSFSHSVPYIAWLIFKEELTNWSIKQFETNLNVTWNPYLKIDHHYLFELMFSGDSYLSVAHSQLILICQLFNLLGFSVGKKDMKFRRKYGKIMYESSGDSNLILAKVDDNVC